MKYTCLHAYICAGFLLFCLGTGAVSGADEDERTFRDCDTCPVMTVVPAGQFIMGSPEDEAERDQDEGPQTVVIFSRPFAVGIFEVTFSQWDACHAAGGCDIRPDDVNWGRGPRPVFYVNRQDAEQYVQWLSGITGQNYRLLTEAEWEYAGRADTQTPFHYGTALSMVEANIDGSRPYNHSFKDIFRSRRSKAVGGYTANAFELHDIHGNVSEWVADCYHPDAYAWFPSYPGAVSSEDGACPGLARGGTSHYSGAFARSANRSAYDAGYRGLDVGFRVARDWQE